jgi:DNA-binding transcriptional ArsR family regulator
LWIASRTASRCWASRCASGFVEQLDLHSELCVQALADAVGATQQHVSRHLALLYEDRIVERRQEGRQDWYRLADRSALALLDDVGAPVVSELRDLSRADDDDGRSNGAVTAAG